MKILGPRTRNELLRVRSADIEIGHHGRADSVDGPDICGRRASAVSTRRIEVDRHDLDLDDGRLNRSIREDGAHACEV